jgi:hypothetical protein
VGAFNASESVIADATMMTLGPAAADGGCEEVLVLRAPQAAIQFFVCFAAYGALQFISTCLAPGFTRGHSCIAPTELLLPFIILTD